MGGKRRWESRSPSRCGTLVGQAAAAAAGASAAPYRTTAVRRRPQRKRGTSRSGSGCEPTLGRTTPRKWRRCCCCCQRPSGRAAQRAAAAAPAAAAAVEAASGAAYWAAWPLVLVDDRRGPPARAYSPPAARRRAPTEPHTRRSGSGRSQRSDSQRPAGTDCTGASRGTPRAQKERRCLSGPGWSRCS